MQYDHSVDLVQLGETNHISHPRFAVTNKKIDVKLTRMGLESGYQIVTRINVSGGCNIHGSSLLHLHPFVYILLHDIQQVKLFRYSIEANSVRVCPVSHIV